MYYIDVSLKPTLLCALPLLTSVNIGIVHGFSCINICWVPRKLFEHESARPSVGRVFKLLPRDPANVNALKQPCVIVILAFYTIP